MLILNSGFKMPADGWCQLAPLGEFRHAGAGVIQVIDAESCVAMAARFAADAAVANFAGLLIDFDHFSMQGGQRSEAAGWITGLEARVPGSEFVVRGSGEPTPGPSSEGNRSGLWAQIRWSDVGEAAVSGGRYRFLSPVWSREDCVELGQDATTGWPRMRPVRLLNAAVTNDPNLKGMCPLSNSGQDHRPQTTDHRPSFAEASEGTPGNGTGAAQTLEKLHLDNGTSQGKGARLMKTVIEKLLNHLGLAADTVEAVVLEKLGTLPALTAVADLQNSLRDLQTKHDALVVNLKAVEGELVNRHLAEFEGVISEGSKAFWAGQLVQNRAAALVALGDLREQLDGAGGKVDAGKQDATTRRPLHNRATARPVPPGQGAAGASAEGESKAMKIRNRAHEIAKAEGVAFGVAFRRAEREVIG